MNLNCRHRPYLHWLPDECFYSLCCRQHLLWSNQSNEETVAILFGPDAPSLLHDFPKNLSLLNDEAQRSWGNSEEIINYHSIVPIFFPFQSTERVEEIKEILQGSKFSSLKYRLGLITGRFGGSHPLKACLTCMKNDEYRYGTTYWHLSHQLPGVTACPLHRKLLMESSENRQWSRRLRWVLPDECTLIKNEDLEVSAASLAALHSMSISAVELWKLGPRYHFDATKVAKIYQQAIRRFGTAQKGREAAAEGFARYCSVLQPHPSFSALPRTQRGAIGFISQMARKPRGYCHPLKHLTLISWLFGHVEGFMAAYNKLDELLKNSGSHDLQLLIPDTAVREQAETYKRQSGAPRPKKIFVPIQQEILKVVKSGASKGEVCTRFDVSISTVNRLLRQNPEVRLAASNEQLRKKREELRAVWLATVDERPTASAKTVRKQIPKVYAWLYRNDRTWLLSQCMILPCGRTGNHVSVDWDARDERLCARVMQIMNRSPFENTRLRKRYLYQLVPSLFVSLEQKSHYSKTRELVDKLCN